MRPTIVPEASGAAFVGIDTGRTARRSRPGSARCGVDPTVQQPRKGSIRRICGYFASTCVRAAFFLGPNRRLTCLKVYNPLPQTTSPSIAISLCAADRTGNRR